MNESMVLTSDKLNRRRCFRKAFPDDVQGVEEPSKRKFESSVIAIMPGPVIVVDSFKILKPHPIGGYKEDQGPNIYMRYCVETLLQGSSFDLD